MSLLYIFAASGFEARPVKRIAEASNPGSPLRCGPNDVVLIVCGMGPQNARSKAEKVFADGKPDAALVIGLCGGLKTSLPEGTIVSFWSDEVTEALRSKEEDGEHTENVDSFEEGWPDEIGFEAVSTLPDKDVGRRESE